MNLPILVRTQAPEPNMKDCFDYIMQNMKPQRYWENVSPSIANRTDKDSFETVSGETAGKKRHGHAPYLRRCPSCGKRFRMSNTPTVCTDHENLYPAKGMYPTGPFELKGRWKNPPE